MDTKHESGMAHTQHSYKFDAAIGRILQLMIYSIYTNKDIFLRELISNASDACDKLRYLAIKTPELLSTPLKIITKIDKIRNELSIEDNGIGMNEQDLIENLGTIANSGTQKFLESLESNRNDDLQLIGQFGVGFYSAFMVASGVTVYSTKVGEDVTYIWESDGTENFSIQQYTKTLPRGTTIKLHIKPSEVEYLEKYKLHHIISTYSDHIAFPIELIDGENNKAEVVNKGVVLWARPKSEITQEEYKEFYNHIAHSPDEPWLVIHNKLEGNMEYTSLLFIPKNKPYDLFHPDRKTRIKLYIKRVFITDENYLMPSYLRFMRGIVDSSDLPLNISRETLQHNIIVAKIRKSIVKKILTELQKKAQEEPQEYVQFWLNFGEVLKEGLCEPNLEEKEQLLNVCRFYSSKSGDALMSLDQYIANMKDGQSEIFFLNGEDLDALRQNPQLEGFTKRNIEVLFFQNPVDDFWVNAINQYKNKELKSIVRSNIDLDEIQKIVLNSDANTEVSKDIEVADADVQQLINYIKSVLRDKVCDVTVSTKLINSPACLSVPEGAMNIRMEKILLEQKQLHKRSTKILEINPRHPIIKRITRAMNASEDKDNIIDLVEIVFQQACLVAGETLDNPGAFVAKINAMLLSEV
ncbi:Chaperone protein HtpG [Alphaproteobacteria bacterium]